MFRIGEFSKVSLVSIKTLRHYDEMCLLVPAHIDTATGYRFYTAEQLPRLNQILALKELGFALSEIKPLLDQPISLDAMRELLHQKRVAIAAQIEAEQRRLLLVEAKLQFIERQGVLPDADPLLKSIPTIHALTIREPAPAMQNWDVLIPATRSALQQQGIREAANCLAVFHGGEYDHELVDWELAFPVEGQTPRTLLLPEDRQLTLNDIPAVPTMACVMHRGAYATLSEAYSTLAYWIERNRYQLVGSGREIYHHIDLETSEHITEIQFPVRSIES